MGRQRTAKTAPETSGVINRNFSIYKEIAYLISGLRWRCSDQRYLLDIRLTAVDSLAHVLLKKTQKYCRIWNFRNASAFLTLPSVVSMINWEIGFEEVQSKKYNV